jgi:hypothetical protein
MAQAIFPQSDHAYLFEQVEASEQAGRITYYDRDDTEMALSHRFRFVSDVPFNESHADLRVNFLECWEWSQAKDQVQHLGSPTCGSIKARCISACGVDERGGASNRR